MKIIDFFNPNDHGEFDIQHSDWLDLNSENIELLHQEYAKQFQKICEFLNTQLGKPLKQGQTGPDIFEALNPAIHHFAIYTWQQKTFLICYGQHDRETPLFISSYLLNSKDYDFNHEN